MQALKSELTFEGWDPVTHVGARLVGVQGVPQDPVSVRDVTLQLVQVAAHVNGWHGAQVAHLQGQVDLAGHLAALGSPDVDAGLVQVQ